MTIRGHPRGFALMTVMVFALVLTIAGMVFFALPAYETKGALYRQRSSEAFYLADAALEHARAKFVQDLAWHTDTTGVALGRGTFDLAVTDTTYQGDDNCRLLIATGHVQGANRRVELIARVPPTTLGIPLFVGGDFNANGQVCIHGGIHVNGDGDDSHIKCGGVLTTGFHLTPPAVYTDPGHFPDGTYYYVKGNMVGGQPQGWIYDRNGTRIPLAGNMTDVTSYNSGAKQFVFQFDNGTKLNKYFTGATPVFARAPGDVAAVVNFGEVPLYDPPGSVSPADIVASVDFRSGGSVHATILNSRFVGSDRVDPDDWQGGSATVKQITFEPYYGIAMITHDFQQASGGSNVYMGTENYPALLYVTNDIGTPGSGKLNANFVLHGSIICLGDWYSSGSPELWYDEGFIDNLPGYLGEDWPGGASGTLKVLRWREIAAS